MRVISLRIYPVKSLAGIAVDAAAVEPWGLAHDRRFGVFDEAGENVNARVVHHMLGLNAVPLDADTIRIGDRAGSSIEVKAPVGVEPVPVGLAGQGSAVPADGCVHEWLSARIGKPVRLLWQPDPTRRPIKEKHGGRPGESLSLADDGPLLLTSAASMTQLNSWIADDTDLPDVPDVDSADFSGTDLSGPAPLDILRFRPSVVVDGDVPFAEDDWRGARIGGVEFRTTMRCDRCVMPTIDPVTLAGGKEPIRTLARHRRWDGKTWFGIRLVPLGTGMISVGDRVTAL